MADAAIALPLVVGVSTRAMFDLAEEHHLFKEQGHEAYALLQREREAEVLRPGVAFTVIQRLLALNVPGEQKVVTVILLSQNSPDLSLRAFRSCQNYGLDVAHGSFTSGRSVAPFVKAWGIDLFLSNDNRDVRAVVEAGAAAAHFGDAPTSDAAAMDDEPADLRDEVRIALDGDAVVFSDQSDQIYKKFGLN